MEETQKQQTQQEHHNISQERMIQAGQAAINTLRQNQDNSEWEPEYM
jgi:hypothetical protein